MIASNDGPRRFAEAFRGNEWIVLAAAIIAVASALPYAGGWNDGSRLAAVQMLAERGTLQIDDSVFVTVSAPVYDPTKPGLQLLGTLDKLRIDGHYYSDKSPVPTVLMAGLYRGWLALGGPTVAERPDLVIRFLTIATSGFAYIFAVWCILCLGRRLGLSGTTLIVFAGGFALATVALPYTRHVNNHILLLGVSAGVCLLLADEPRRWTWPAVGSLAGLGYTIDLGAGPPLLAAVLAFAAYRTDFLSPKRQRGVTDEPSLTLRAPLIALVLAATPWFALHHTINYAIGGTIGPANAVPAYLNWPGSPFTAETMTGGLKHTPVQFAAYALDLLFGQKGIISNNLPLWLVLGGAVRLWLWQRACRPAVAFCLGWCGCVWLLYAATSNNYGGQSASVRWFVAFAAPGYWVIGMLLAAEPKFRRDLRWLTLAGLPVAGLMWWFGPWMPRMVPGLWGWLALGGIGWAYIYTRDKIPSSAMLHRSVFRFLMTRSSSAA